MTLDEFVEKLEDLQAQGHGKKEVVIYFDGCDGIGPVQSLEVALSFTGDAEQSVILR